MWTLSRFPGPITENQAHFGIRSVLGSTDIMADTNAVHTHTFAAFAQNEIEFAFAPILPVLITAP